ncbi:MAG: endopeptidase La [Firmicutes bacterium]|nr:endopeptidase La [Bacillota bacterium]MDD4692876.1 endopeptidase La [Bacillota bacterium]
MTSLREEWPLMPLRGMLVYPGMVTPLEVGRERSINALEQAMVDDRKLILVAQKEARVKEPETDDIYDIGTMVEIKQLLKLPEGHIRILVEGLSRVKVHHLVQIEPYYTAKVEILDIDESIDKETEALMRSASTFFEKYVKLSKKLPLEVVAALDDIKEPGKLADNIASQLAIRIEDKQQALATFDVKERLELLNVLLSRELEILELEKNISSRVRRQMDKSQRDYYLREQLRAIRQELGEDDDKAEELDEYREKIEKLALSADTKEKALKEVSRLEKMPPGTAEAVVVRNYLDWIIALPWKTETKDNIDIVKAENILDADHYGLDKIKERILEFLAVRKLTKSMKGPILCLVGPPGVGKTSLAKSVARALNRKFVRFSLGGVRDEAEIRGHRRTYVGALPGKIIQSMRDAKSKNPVILLDEVDKMSSDFKGDPASALLEVLDPEQNNAFQDHFLEVPFDLSRVMFITTANNAAAIPQPLWDRMEVIEIPGYTELEKLEIALRHLMPKQLEAHGLKAGDVEISKAAVLTIIREYTKEAGVRSLERTLASLYRKAAKEIVLGKEKPVRISRSSLEKYLGVRHYTFGLAETEDKVGVATGLVWTPVGGDIVSIEVSIVPGKGGLTLTGKLGDVMKESAQAALSYIRYRAEDLGIDLDFHKTKDIHIHVPEGAVPKEGPSAGITMATALVSALSEKPVRWDIAMTGEITLRGRVLPIGGLKEKLLGAQRAGIKTVLIPKTNERDLKEVPKEILKGLTVIPVGHMDEVLKNALRDTDEITL